MARSVEATKFFTISLKGLLGYLILSLFGKSFTGLLPSILKIALATVLASLIFKPLLNVILRTMKSFLGVFRQPLSCCVVASIIKSCLFLSKDVKSLQIPLLVSIGMLSVVALGWDRDHSGMTEGILIASGKWFVINCMALKLEESAGFGIVLAFSIFSLLTSVGEPLRDRADDRTPLKQNPYYEGEPNECRQKSARVIKFFRLCSMVIKCAGVVGTIWVAYRSFLGYTTSPMLLILGIVSSVASFVGGIILLKEMLTGFLKYQQAREERAWFVMLGVMGLFETFFDENMIPQLIVMSAASMYIVCVITTGWDHDRTGVTDGLAVTYFQWTLVVLINSKSSLQAVVCGLTLCFVVASKFTEPLEKEKES